MVTEVQAARDKPVVSRVDIFDSLLTISFLTKALAKEVLTLNGDKGEGGKKDGTKKSFGISSK